jgi:hypothetical protein
MDGELSVEVPPSRIQLAGSEVLRRVAYATRCVVQATVADHNAV